MKMLPLIDGAGYKLFDTKMLSLTDGARNKLFGMKMLPHLPYGGGAFLLGVTALITLLSEIHLIIFFADIDRLFETMKAHLESASKRDNYKFRTKKPPVTEF